MTLNKPLFDFLKSLAANNNRDWFAENKAQFDGHNTDIKSFFKDVADDLETTDHLENHKVYRIYRDVRFSKNKDPYKTGFNGYFRRATAHNRGGYFLNIEPGNTYVGGGFYGPNAEDLSRIRREFEMDDTEIREILSNKAFKSFYGELKGQGLKTAPRGFEKDSKAIDLIRMKQFYVSHSFTDKEVLSPGFQAKVGEGFKFLRPYFDYMSDVLTTDLNGVPVV